MSDESATPYRRDRAAAWALPYCHPKAEPKGKKAEAAEAGWLKARTIDDIVEEMRTTRVSERSGRLIDHDQEASMERKKREGYF